MGDTPEPVSDREREVAERVLGARLRQVRLGEGTLLEGSSRSRVARFTVHDGPSDLPASVIAKRTLGMGGAEDTPDRPDSPTVRFLNEWASLLFLDETGFDPPLAPRLYAGDRDAGLLVMEDLGTAKAGHLEAIGELAGTLSRELHGRWDGETEPMPLYPACRAG